MNVTTLPNATDRTDLVEITADRKRWTPPRAAVGAAGVVTRSGSSCCPLESPITQLPS